MGSRPRINRKEIGNTIIDPKDLMTKTSLKKIPVHIISQRAMYDMIDTIIDDKETLNSITEGYKIPQEKNSTSNNQAIGEYSIVKAKLITNRIKRKKEEHSYKGSQENYIKYPERFEKFKEKISNYKLEEVIFNGIFEIIIADLFQHLMNEAKEKGAFPNFKSVKVYTTNLYDDVMSGTDLIIAGKTDGENTFGRNDHYLSIDFTTCFNQEIFDKKNEITETSCRDFGEYSGYRRKMHRKVIQISNPEFLYNYMRAYLYEINALDTKEIDSIHIGNILKKLESTQIGQEEKFAEIRKSTQQKLLESMQGK